MKGLVFSHVISINISFNFWKFQLFYFTTPMNLKLFLYTIDWLWSLSILSISIHYPIFSNYQSYLFYAILYITSIFYPFYTFILILSILSIVSISIHFYPYLCPFSYILSFLSILNPLMSICGLLCPKACEDGFCKVENGFNYNVEKKIISRDNHKMQEL
jgi:hypothetical protein